MANKPAVAASTNNYFIILALVSLLAIGVAGLISKSLITTIIRDHKVVTAKSTANNMLKGDVTAAPQLVSSFNGLSAGTATILTHALPNTSDFPGLISLMEVAGSQAGVSVTTIAPDTSSSGDSSDPTSGSDTASAQEFPYTFEVTGTYDTFQKFFANIEHSARPIRITNVELSGTGSALTGTFSATTYYQDKATLPFSTETIK